MLRVQEFFRDCAACQDAIDFFHAAMCSFCQGPLELFGSLCFRLRHHGLRSGAVSNEMSADVIVLSEDAPSLTHDDSHAILNGIIGMGDDRFSIGESRDNFSVEPAAVTDLDRPAIYPVVFHDEDHPARIVTEQCAGRDLRDLLPFPDDKVGLDTRAVAKLFPAFW